MWEQLGKFRLRLLLVGTAVAAAVLFWFVFPRLPRPPEPGTVAVYQGGRVTAEELRRYLHEYLRRCPRHLRCRRHGEDHNACGGEEECESFVGCSAEHAEAENLEVYRRAAIRLIVDRMIGDLLARKKLAERKRVRHLMKHVTEEISLADLGRAIHEEKVRVDEADIEQFYNENREMFGARSIREVSDQIRDYLVEKKEKPFIRNFLKRLREDSALSVNYELLIFPEPTEDQIRTLYFEKRDEMRKPAGAKITLVQSGDEMDNEEVKEVMREARFLLLSGADAAELRKKLGPKAEYITIRDNLAVSETDELWKTAGLDNLIPGEVTGIADNGGRLVVARLRDRTESRRMSFEEARESLAEQLRGELRTRYLAENGGATLFTIHGEPYARGEFMEEFEELPPYEQTRFADYDGMKKLVDMMIERALLVEAASDDPDVANTGGRIAAWIGETDALVSELFLHPFHENVPALRKGELSPVFRMGDSLFVVWVREREEPKDISFEEAKEFVRRDLREIRHYELTAELESRLVSKAGARIYDYTLLNMLREDAGAAEKPERRSR